MTRLKQDVAIQLDDLLCTLMFLDLLISFMRCVKSAESARLEVENHAYRFVIEHGVDGAALTLFGTEHTKRYDIERMIRVLNDNVENCEVEILCPGNSLKLKGEILATMRW